MAKADAKSTIPADPIYLAIERHKNAARLWAAAVSVSAAFPDGANPMTLEQQAIIDAAVAGARLPMIDAGLDLIETAPTTIGGIVAALEYMRDQLQDDGDTMPANVLLDTVGDNPVTIGWLDAFVDTLADAAADEYEFLAGTVSYAEGDADRVFLQRRWSRAGANRDRTNGRYRRACDRIAEL